MFDHINEAQLQNPEIIELNHRVEGNETNVFELKKRGNVSLKFIRRFEILRRVRQVAYELPLPSSLVKFHYVFHVLQLRKYVHDPSHVLAHKPLQIDESLAYVERPIRFWILESKN